MTQQGAPPHKPPAFQPVAPLRKHKMRALAITAAVVLGFALIALYARSHAGGTTITLRATGGSAMDVAYIVGDRNSQDTSAASPWSVSYSETGGMPSVTMTVQNGGGGSATVSCSISEGGKVVARNTSQGAFAVVQCSA